MSYFTDIASEIYEKHKNNVPRGVEMQNYQSGCVNITRVNITKSGLNRAPGKYVTLDMPLLQHTADKNSEHVITLANELAELLPKLGSVMVAGVGNSEVTADALGPLTVKRVLATSKTDELMPRRVFAITPGVEGSSGISTKEYLTAIISQIQPSVLICVDSLLTRSSCRLGTSVQLSTSGLAPGTVRELSEKTLGIPVIAAGVPTMIQIKCGTESMTVTPKNIDFILKRAASLLAASINKALYPALSVSEIDFITF